MSSHVSSFSSLRLFSHFQPIFSLAHRRLVGHEALLRASDPQGRELSPREIFETTSGDDALRALDRASRLVHAGTFAANGRTAEWLFLNVDAGIFRSKDMPAARRLLEDVCVPTGLPPHQVVIEILEEAIEIDANIVAQVGALKKAGFLIALDDFGAGHSNFDRVFELGPTIVKLDRSVVVRAAQSQTVRRVTTQMVSLLHECGALVLMEGVERRGEAMVALDSDADFVQGFYFGRPASELKSAQAISSEIDETWHLSDAQWHEDRQAYSEKVRPYINAIRQARTVLAHGGNLEQACKTFLSLQGADVCYLLDASGQQTGVNVFSRRTPRPSLLGDTFSPLRDSSTARWSRRPYFRRAVSAPGKVQVTRPYLTMQSQRMCVTFSICFEQQGIQAVVCGDVLWDADDVRPDFALSGPGHLV